MLDTVTLSYDDPDAAVQVQRPRPGRMQDVGHNLTKLLRLPQMEARLRVLPPYIPDAVVSTPEIEPDASLFQATSILVALGGCAGIWAGVIKLMTLAWG